MTIRSEIRAALAGGTPLSEPALLLKVPSLDGYRQKLICNLKALKNETRVRIAGTSDEGKCWTLDSWPVDEYGRTVMLERGTVRVRPMVFDDKPDPLGEALNSGDGSYKP